MIMNLISVENIGKQKEISYSFNDGHILGSFVFE